MADLPVTLFVEFTQRGADGPVLVRVDSIVFARPEYRDGPCRLYLDCGGTMWEAPIDETYEQMCNIIGLAIAATL